MVHLLNICIRKRVFIQLPKLQLLCRHPRYGHTDVRVRFAPSPSGDLHIGGARSALYNYLFAKSNGGKFILRIEDTNQEKCIPNVDIELEKELSWLKIFPDESPILGGDYGPYKQSERNALYIEHANILLSNGSAYKCFCDAEKLAMIKENNFIHNCHSLSGDEIKNLEGKGVPFCIRFKTKPETMEYHDLVFQKRILPPTPGLDPVILKSSNRPTFFLASVVDDYFMEISHVLRGFEWMAHMHLIQSLYRAFEWTPPKYGHLPQLLNIADGTKLSKREGDISIANLRQEGYSPEVILNAALASGGGFARNPNQFMTLPYMIDKFSVRRLAKNEGVWNCEKLKVFGKIEFKNKLSSASNKETMIAELRNLLTATYNESFDVNLTDKYLSNVLDFAKLRVSNLVEVANLSYLWTDEVAVDPQLIMGFNQELTEKIISRVYEALSELPTNQFEADHVNATLTEVRESLDMAVATFMKILRIHLCGRAFGPPVHEVLSLLGKDMTLARLKKILSVDH